MEGYSVSHVFHGLMCFSKGPSSKIYNTTTRQLVVLPDVEESNMFMAENDNFKQIMFMYQIGYDPVQDQYKVVCRVARRTFDEFGRELPTFLPEHWVLLLGGDGSSRWRKIPSICPPHIIIIKLWTINGGMHYLAWVRYPDLVLVSFDISTEEISMLQLPEDIQFSWKTNIIEYGGKVAILGYTHLKTKGMMKLWVMEDADKNRWSKTLVLHSSQIPIVDKTNLLLHSTTRNGEVMFLITQSSSPTRRKVLEPQNKALFYIFLYDLQKNHMRKVEVKETPNGYLTKFCDVAGLDDVENLIYL
ncbi:unnamed protein product [Microthlaspi erraticum]|uniref:F-box associated beta-propeller type 3 domain-containing protein n=1 Tax=Microthlaspi erraticum TaxID=1685480 RepID=A0A6D2I206_9BRAS|nr:unnamed protein product [Microthlaspi erraticum]CAA7057224.1 unnamed protein product [Microthlaspi erraticum]